MKHVLIVEDRKDSMLHLSIVLDFLGYPSRRVTVNRKEFFESFSCELYACIIGEIKRKRLYSSIVSELENKNNIPVISFFSQGYFLHHLSNLVGELPKELDYKGVKDAFEHVKIFHKFKNSYSSDCGKIFETFRGSSFSIHTLRETITKVATTDATIMLLGETGTGKEYAARTIHKLSNRRDGPFIAINCSAISYDLLESELFGHEKGAFTSAIGTKKGRFELSDGGTLFLDEIGDLPLTLQVKLLRVLQDCCITRIGGVKTIPLNFRLIVATHRNLDGMILNGTFREDFFYRISVFPILVPSLSDRIEDLPVLISQQLEYIDKYRRVKFSNSAIHSLKKCSWKGNLRELSNLIERLVILYPGETICLGKLPAGYKVGDGDFFDDEECSNELSRNKILERYESNGNGLIVNDNSSANSSDLMCREILNDISYRDLPLKEYLREIEVNYIKLALAESSGVVTAAAKKLTMSRTTLVEKIKRFAL